MSPDVSVIICSLNGAAGVERCLHTLAAQNTTARVELIVVDDGSIDDTSAVAGRHGATVIRHETNRGLAASRNAGIRAAHGSIIAFLDDDCEADPYWIQHLLAAYVQDVVGVGGDASPIAGTGYISGFLRRNNPLAVLEMELARSNALRYRLWLYLRAQATVTRRSSRRRVSSLLGANMSFRRDALLEVGLFDERFTFGAEELDLCWRLGIRFPDRILIVEPAAAVSHRFQPTVRDTLRRGRAYGRGSARLYRKWPRQRPTIFPFPFVEAILVAAAFRKRQLLGWAVLWPLIAYPSAARHAVRDRSPQPLVDAYLLLSQEHQTNVGFVQGLWEFRDFAPEPG